MMTRLIAVSFSAAIASAAFSQTPPNIQVISPLASASAAAAAAAKSASPTAQSSPSIAASAPVAANAPVKFSNPGRPESQLTAAEQPASAEIKTVPQKPVAKDKKINRTAEGTKVYRAQVSGEDAAAEASVLAQMPVPGYKPGSSGSGVSPASASTPTVSGLGEVKALPKWVTGSLDKTSGRNQILVLPGVTEIVRVARNFPNRFTTPFENAEVITTDENLTHDGVGGVVVVATASDKPIGIFIQDRNSDRAIALVLIPEDIPQRDIRLQLDDSWGPPQLRNIPEPSGAGVPSAQSDYVDYIKMLMRGLAKGEVPDGHAVGPIQAELAPACQMPGLQIRLGQMLEGAKTRIAVYTAANQTQSTIPIQESGCYRSGVLAVSAFPRPVLEPGQDSEVYVILRKDNVADRTSAKRRQILVSQ